MLLRIDGDFILSSMTNESFFFGGWTGGAGDRVAGTRGARAGCPRPWAEAGGRAPGLGAGGRRPGCGGESRAWDRGPGTERGRGSGGASAGGREPEAGEPGSPGAIRFDVQRSAVQRWDAQRWAGSARRAIAGPLRRARAHLVPSFHGSVRTLHGRPGSRSSPGRSGGVSLGWAGVFDGVVGEGDGEFSVGVEGDVPAGVVDFVVVVDTHGEQVVEVGVSVVAPPGDVVEFAAVVCD